MNVYWIDKIENFFFSITLSPITKFLMWPQGFVSLLTKVIIKQKNPYFPFYLLERALFKNNFNIETATVGIPIFTNLSRHITIIFPFNTYEYRFPTILRK